jgi:toxin YoeB
MNSDRAWALTGIVTKRSKSEPAPEARVAVFHAEFREDLRYWVKAERKTAFRVLKLVEATLRDPFQGTGKPEPLKFYLQGCWSRRVTQEHRLVYLVTAKRVDFLQARYHY